MDTGLSLLLIICGILVGILVYFIPTLVAWKADKENSNVIFLLNLFTGWSLIGWIAALIWAGVDKKREEPTIELTDIIKGE